MALLLLIRYVAISGSSQSAAHLAIYRVREEYRLCPESGQGVLRTPGGAPKERGRKAGKIFVYFY